jgi:transketolase
VTLANNDQLRELCTTVRRDIVEMTAAAGSGHPGGSLSAVELVVGLYFNVMRHDPANPTWSDRDRFILSKGHACPVLYSVLARSGYFPADELKTLRKFGSRLQGHPNMQVLPGLDTSSGSLGQGLSISNGLAIAAKLDGKDHRIYCLLGDGEIQEGQVWEAAMTAAHYKLDNVCAILDYNNLQIDGCCDDVMCIAPVADKWLAFGWNVIEVDGHNLDEVLLAYQRAASVKCQPTIIIAKTIKGKGVSFMEDVAEWHGKAPNAAELAVALKELA